MTSSSTACWPRSTARPTPPSPGPGRSARSRTGCGLSSNITPASPRCSRPATPQPPLPRPSRSVPHPAARGRAARTPGRPGLPAARIPALPAPRPLPRAGRPRRARLGRQPRRTVHRRPRHPHQRPPGGPPPTPQTRTLTPARTRRGHSHHPGKQRYPRGRPGMHRWPSFTSSPCTRRCPASGSCAAMRISQRAVVSAARCPRRGNVPGQQRCLALREDSGPAPARYEPWQRGEPHPVGWLVPHPDQLFGGDGDVLPSATVNPSLSVSAADGDAIMAVPALLTMKISLTIAPDAALSSGFQTGVPGGAVLNEPGSNVTLLVLARVARRPPSSGRSWMASALLPDDLYFTVLPPLLPVVKSITLIFQVPAVVSLTRPSILSPGLMTRPEITTSGAGMISVHASYFAVPPMLSASVPAWTQVLSLKPPIPTQSEEYWLPEALVFTVGTRQKSRTALNVPLWVVDWAYPDQLKANTLVAPLTACAPAPGGA